MQKIEPKDYSNDDQQMTVQLLTNHYALANQLL